MFYKDVSSFKGLDDNRNTCKTASNELWAKIAGIVTQAWTAIVFSGESK